MVQTNRWRGRLKMTPYQFGLVMLCMFICILDGYDIFVVGYVLPHLSDEFATPSEKGYLISAALIGMGIGAMFLARIADVIGRRPTLLAGLVVNIAGLVASALTTNYGTLLAARFITGAAVGVISVAIIVMCQEISPPSQRSISIGILTFGVPFGGLLAGTFATTLVEATGDWETLFWIGAALTTLCLVASLFFLPESVAFLRRKPGAAAIHAARAAAAKLNLEEPEVNETPPGGATAADIGLEKPAANDTPPRQAKVLLLGREFRSLTLVIWGGYALLLTAFYFVGTWTPQLITTATGDSRIGATVGTVISLGTMTGALCYTFLGMRRPAAQVAGSSLVVAAAALLAFSFSVSLLGAFALTMAALMGVSTFIAVAAFTHLANTAYPVLARAKGYGAMSGMGRIGAVLGPIIAGHMVAIMSPRGMYTAVVIPLAVAALLAFCLHKKMRKETVAHTPPASAPNAAAIAKQPRSSR